MEVFPTECQYLDVLEVLCCHYGDLGSTRSVDDSTKGLSIQESWLLCPKIHHYIHILFLTGRSKLNRCLRDSVWVVLWS